ncbi:MAG: 50S ribosomal protein L18 [Parcubacteria group bacterium CG08_land_8_20_14_0_20_48_21]|nr:MAG: 50S ribosomal protein L18 [Parcubacteria group bacterium CG2_30_48_51]PIS32640.1 MAG: 50S ribosomal protein L18 [Parcubacteria group bacterium CG08_land_8_20_14_0_20_48_21]PIW79303.1 MAG: 50S ribosomal protein L18 [Parcubacteria group bacterium CG_4_8_14_3_um_filter_48_16]PIY77604.1 MAG: 50S ribosomal protein L18 [Parcubacteria group bacterium CG_4_10_14_0_8_um_filter_48_154]PIZ77189.1 MAG: 50S ribosomal protein L18 [bacterium CG_4_10_14_0_2_um_filter_48_144]PJC40143.1 MAG: 50S ribosom
MKLTKHQGRIRRHKRIRATVRGTADRPRLCVFRGLRFIEAQIIDDAAGKTLCAVSSTTLTGKKGTKTEQSAQVGKQLGKIAKEKGIDTIVFDRGGYAYHGRVKALAESAREAGLQF